jgi:hypothetical protein
MKSYCTVLLLAFSVSAQAQPDQCAQISGTISGAQTLSSVITKARALGLKKDPYESAAKFEERAKAAGAASFGKPITILWDQADLTKFDPETGRVIVGRYSVNTTCSMFKYELPPEFAGIHVGNPPKYDWQKQDIPYCLTKKATSQQTGTYVGSNAYGARRVVRSLLNTEIGIYLGTGLIGMSYYPTSDFSSVDASPWLSVEATVDEARSLSRNAALLLLIEPKAPYYATGKYYREATIDSPTSLELSKRFVIANPLCIALIDKVSGKVFARRPFEFRND